MKSKRPKISVIIPTYNRAIYICEAIDSVLNQTYKNLEIIVVDDGSKDHTRKVIHGYSDQRIRYIYKENGGLPSALNLGLDLSKGEYIARLDSDDIFMAEKLEMQMRILENDPWIGLVYTQAYDMDHEGQILGLYLKDHECPKEPLKVLRHFLFPPTQSIMFKRSCFESVGYFDDRFPIAEDWDFCIRMAKCCKFAYINKPLVKIRRHPGMITIDKIKTASYILQVMKKHTETLSLGNGKSWLGAHYYDYGRLFFYKRDYPNARQSFFTALKYNPKSIQNLFFYSLTFFPGSIIQTFRSLKRLFTKLNPSIP